MRVIVDGTIRINKSELSRENKRNILSSYTFYARSYTQEVEVYMAYSLDRESGDIILPCNLSFLKKRLAELEINDYEIIDTRASYKLEGLRTDLKLLDKQVPIMERLEGLDYNALLELPTGWGKTASMIWLAEKLQSTMLFTASRTTLIDNFLQDCETFKVDSKLITKIDKAWLKNPIITPLMYVTSTTLTNSDITKALYGKVSLLVADEVHLSIMGIETQRALSEINPKHRVYLSATAHSMKFKGLTECLLSDNWIQDIEELDYKVGLQSLNIDLGSGFRELYYSYDTYHEKKAHIFSNEVLLEEIARLSAYIVKKYKRGVLLYLESIEAHGSFVRYLQKYGLKIGVLNSKTKKAERTAILEGFDKGDYEVLIGGSSLSAGLSFYRLSVVINLNITLNGNNLTQLIGRLKRVNPEVSTHSKEFIQVIYPRISDRKWARDKKILDKFDYIEHKVGQTYDILGEATILECFEGFDIDNKIVKG